MNPIALNHIAQLRQTKRATVKVKTPIITTANIDREPVKPSHNPSSTAKRLINTKHLSHEQWLEVRQQGIGSSDAAAACGIHPYLSMLELWMIKTGRMSSDIEDSANNIKGYSPLYWGTTLEPMVAKYSQFKIKLL